MKSDHSANLAQRRQGSIVAVGLHLIATAVCLLCFSMSPVFGQNTYSDTWFDGSGVGSVAGCGVTDGSYTHSYYVDTTLRSPNGRTDYRSSGRHTGYARIDVSLPWDWNDMGNYLTESEHFARCPGDDLNYYSIGTTSAGKSFGYSVVYYEYGHIDPGGGGYVYYIVDDCARHVTCYRSQWTGRPVGNPAPPQVVVVFEPFGFDLYTAGQVVCFKPLDTGTGVPARGDCHDRSF